MTCLLCCIACFNRIKHSSSRAAAHAFSQTAIHLERAGGSSASSGLAVSKREGCHPSSRSRGDNPVETLTAKLIANSTAGSASSHLPCFLAVYVRRICPMVLLVCLLRPLAWGWKADEQWKRVERRDIRQFQNLADQVLSRSLMMDKGAPKREIHPAKNLEAVFLAVSFWSTGIIRVKPESRHVIDNNIS